jgi:hypothetical protein
MEKDKSTPENETSLRDFIDRATDAILKPGSEKEPWWFKPLLAFCAVIYIVNPKLANRLVQGLLENTRNIWEDIKDFLGKIPEKLPRLWTFIEEYAPQVKDKLQDWGNSSVEAIDRLQLIVTTSFANFFDDERRARLRQRYRLYRNTALILLGIGLLPFATMLLGLAPIPALPIIRLAGVIGAAMIFVPVYLILWLSLSVTQKRGNVQEGHLRRRTNFSELFKIGVILACGWVLVGNWLIAPLFLIPMALVLLFGAVFTPTPLAIRNTRRTFMGALGLLMFGVTFSFIADRQPQLHQFVRGFQAPIEFKAMEVWDSARGTSFLTNEEGQRPYRSIKTATPLLKPNNFQNGCLTGERFRLLEPGEVVTVQFEKRKGLKVTQTDEFGRIYRLVILPPHPDSASVAPITGYVFEGDLQAMPQEEAYSIRNDGRQNGKIVPASSQQPAAPALQVSRLPIKLDPRRWNFSSGWFAYEGPDMNNPGEPGYNGYRETTGEIWCPGQGSIGYFFELTEMPNSDVTLTLVSSSEFRTVAPDPSLVNGSNIIINLNSWEGQFYAVPDDGLGQRVAVTIPSNAFMLGRNTLEFVVVADSNGKANGLNLYTREPITLNTLG